MKFILPEFEVRDAIGSLSEIHGWGLSQSKIPNAWKVTKGKGINIVVADTGRPDHPDLDGAIVASINCTNEKDEFDYNGHSTAICSILCAQENDQGIVGICPEATITTVKVMGSDGSGDIPSLYNGLKFVLEEATSRGKRTGYTPNILVCSLGLKVPFPSFIEELFIKLYNAGVVIVCAAGNSGKEIEYPAAYPECIAVGSYDKEMKVSSFSAKGKKLEFTCPGQDIYACFLNGTYKIVRGTSFSGPFLSGIIALALAKHRDQELLTGKNDMKTVNDVRKHLVKYSSDIGKTGKDDEYGYGAINVEDLINSTESTESLPELIPFERVVTKKSWWKKLLGL